MVFGRKQRQTAAAHMWCSSAQPWWFEVLQAVLRLPWHRVRGYAETNHRKGVNRKITVAVLMRITSEQHLLKRPSLPFASRKGGVSIFIFLSVNKPG